VDLRPAPGLQLIQVVLADHHVPAKNLVLRDTGLVVRIAVANPVERGLRLVVDKEYDEITGRLFFKDTHVPEMLRLGRSRLDVAITPLMLIDSLDLTDADRQRVVGLEVRA
jgi:hypothetical protein